MNNKFLIEDRVRFYDQEGTVIVIPHASNPAYGVEMDIPFQGGHNLNGEITSTRGYWVNEEELKLLEPKPFLQTI